MYVIIILMIHITSFLKQWISIQFFYILNRFDEFYMLKRYTIVIKSSVRVLLCFVDFVFESIMVRHFLIMPQTHFSDL